VLQQYKNYTDKDTQNVNIIHNAQFFNNKLLSIIDLQNYFSAYTFDINITTTNTTSSSAVADKPE